MTKFHRAEIQEINKVFPVGELFESNLIRRGFLKLFNNDLLELLSDDDFLSDKTFTIRHEDILVRLNLEVKGDFVKVFVLNKNQVCWIVLDNSALERLKPL